MSKPYLIYAHAIEVIASCPLTVLPRAAAAIAVVKGTPRAPANEADVMAYAASAHSVAIALAANRKLQCRKSGSDLYKACT